MGSVGLDALRRLSDVLAQEPGLADKRIGFITGQCPPLGSLRQNVHSSAPQLHGQLALARFLAHFESKQQREDLLGYILEFIEAVPSMTIQDALWSHPFSSEKTTNDFFLEFTSYIANISESWPLAARGVSRAIASVVEAVDPQNNVNLPCRAFLSALSTNWPLFDESEIENLSGCLLSRWVFSQIRSTVNSNSAQIENTPDDTSSMDNSPFSSPGTFSPLVDAAAAIGDPIHVNGLIEVEFVTGFNQPKLQSVLETDAVNVLERQKVAFRLFVHLLDTKNNNRFNDAHLEQLRLAAAKHIKSLLPLLKVRRRDMNVRDASLKLRMCLRLEVSQAAAVLLLKSLSESKESGKYSKGLLRETLALLMDAADACIGSPWRRLKACEVLFENLMSCIAEIAVKHGAQIIRVILHRLKLLVLSTCAYADTWGTNQGPIFKCVVKESCYVIQNGWTVDRCAVESFILSLAAHIRQQAEQEEKEKQAMAIMQLNVIPLLADIAIMLNKPEAVDMITPMFIESLEEGDASVPGLLRLRLLDAVARMASLGFEKSYREAVALLTKSYKDKLSTVGSTHSRTLAPEATTERVETLPVAFHVIACGLRQYKLRVDYRQKLLNLCSEVGLVAEAKRSGADLLGPLLPAVAEICSDFEPSLNVEPSLLKLFRNLWFYIVLFGLAPPIQEMQAAKFLATSMSSLGSMSATALQGVEGPYQWNGQWSAAVLRITEATPPLVVSSVKFLEDEFELNALHNPGSRRGNSNEKAATAQRAALARALGGRVEVSSLSTISGVNATYLLAVAFLEVLRFTCNGGMLRNKAGEPKSSLSCTVVYLEIPKLTAYVYQCLSAIVHRAFDAAIKWLGEQGSRTEERDDVLITHACFLIRHLSHRNENVREMADSLLSQLRNRFPQVLWNLRCLESLLLTAGNHSALNHTPPVSRLLLQQRVREWITYSLMIAPSTTHGLLQEQFRKLNSWQKAAQTSELLSLFSELKLDVTKADGVSNGQAVVIPAVIAAAAAAAGANPQLAELGNIEVLSTGVISANVKSNYVGEIVGMKKLMAGMHNIDRSQENIMSVLLSFDGVSKNGNNPVGKEDDWSFRELLFSRFLQSLQQFVTAAENKETIDPIAYHESCLRATALILSDMDTVSQNSSQLLRLLCWCPAYIFTLSAMETGIFVWTWLLSAAPHLSCPILSELVDAWLWTIDTKRGLFASGMENSGPAAKLRPQLTPGEPLPVTDPVEGLLAHRLWLGFLMDRFEVVRHSCNQELLLIGRLLQGSVKSASHFSSHPAATGTFFTLMLLGLKFCASQIQKNSCFGGEGIYLLEDRIYRAALSWFASEPGWYDFKIPGISQAESQAVSLFVQQLTLQRPEIPEINAKSGIQENGSSPGSNLENVSAKADGKEKRKQLLLLLCHHEADRLESWAFPLKEILHCRFRLHSDRLAEHVRTAWAVNSRIALALVSRFPSAALLRNEVAGMVQGHLSELRDIPEALPFFVTPRAVEENSPVLQQLPHWAPCSITRALEFLTPPYKGHPRVMAYVLRVLESYPPERVTFFMPQLVQALRYDDGGLVEGYLMVAAKRSNLFAHILIWQLQGEELPLEEINKESQASKENPLYDIVPRVKSRIIDSFSSEAYDVFRRQFRFFDQVTSISGLLYPLPKEERRAAIRRELEKIEVDGDDLYLPTAPSKLVRSIELDSGIPLQSAAKVPIMITFDVVDKEGDPKNMTLQACIFKVGDDCRQDVLALQVIALLRDIFTAIGLDLYLFPYGVLPTGYGRGIIEVVPNTRSRNQMGEISDGGLYELFQQDYGPVGSPRFEAARDMFIVSSAGYAVASLLLQPKDRHNGNLLFDSEGRLVHIDFGFILETSPGGNLRFESAQFKLSHEMTQLIDPSGSMKSDSWNRFVSLCVKGYLGARQHMEGIVNTVLLMKDSGLPCFSRGDPIGNLRKRFHPEMSEREAANFMIRTCADAYNKWSTAGYDLIQYLQQGIEK